MFPKIFGCAGDEAPPSPNSETTPLESDQSPEVGANAEPDSEVTAAGPTKMSQAIEIYRRMTRKKGTARREIIEVFIEKVGLTKSGAATYYQMIKKARRQD